MKVQQYVAVALLSAATVLIVMTSVGTVAALASTGMTVGDCSKACLWLAGAVALALIAMGINEVGRDKPAPPRRVRRTRRSPERCQLTRADRRAFAEIVSHLDDDPIRTAQRTHREQW